MVSRKLVEEFLAEKKLAFVGVSRNERQFANSAFRALRQAGYVLFPVHADLNEVDGVRCYRRLGNLPERVGGLIVMVAPARAAVIVEEASAAGIRRIWFQQQGCSDEALRACERLGIAAVHDQCVMMFMPGTAFPHRAHRFVNGLFGRLPR